MKKLIPKLEYSNRELKMELRKNGSEETSNNFQGELKQGDLV
jgi:hypothetical protein